MNSSKKIKIDHIDHVVLTVKDVNKTIDFYTNILGFELNIYGKDEKKALNFGSYKLNIHSFDKSYEPIAKNPLSGSLDICLVSTTPLKEIMSFLNEKNIPIELGPIRRTGATQMILSIYIRDPDGNLLEIANEVT